MMRLSQSSPGFSKPDLPPERWAEIERAAAEHDRAERARMVDRRIKASGMPREFRTADLSRCRREAADFASEACRSLEEGRSMESLLIRGRQGRGKTYTACAVLRAFASRHPEAPALFTSLHRMVREMRDARSSFSSEGAVLSRYANARLLVVDDLGKEQVTERDMPAIFDLVDSRYGSGRATVYTTQKDAVSLGEHYARAGTDTAQAMLSRILSCRTLQLDGPDRRLA